MYRIDRNLKRMKKALLILIVITACKPAFSQKILSFNDSLAFVFSLSDSKPFVMPELEDTGGFLFNTSLLAEKTVYVDFWFTACSPCVKEIPYAKTLEAYFSADTNIVFLSICIENVDRKTAWKQMIKEKEIGGIQLFYARNRPQKINLLRAYKVTFPTYLLINREMKVISYNAPRPSEEKWVRWAIEQAEKI